MKSEAAEILYEMESEMIANMTRLLASGATASAEWQSEKLAQIGLLRKENEKVLSEYLPRAMAAAREELYSSGIDAAKLIDAGLSDVLPLQADERLKMVWAIWEEKTMNQFRALGMTLIEQSQNEYIKIVYKSTAEALSGIKTLRESIADTASEWLANGIPALIDKAGRQWSVEAYSQVVLRSNVRQVVTQTQLVRMDEYGLDLVEISSHLGARELCAPYQGKVFSRTGSSSKYPPLSSTSYGQKAGLFGINCGHRMYPYNESEGKTFHPYPQKQNESVYEESQKQRFLERNIRKAKRELSIAESLGSRSDIESAKNKVLQRQAEMRDFIEKTERSRRYDREKIY